MIGMKSRVRGYPGLSVYGPFFHYYLFIIITYNARPITRKCEYSKSGIFDAYFQLRKCVPVKADVMTKDSQ